MIRPRVSVMIPCYNAGETLRMALASLRAQTLDDWECVCVDDGSSDDTFALLEQAAAADPRIKVSRFSRNRGRGEARKFLLERVSAPLLAFLDADDWMYPDRLAQQCTWLGLEPSLAAVSAAMTIFEEPLDVVGVAYPRGEDGLPSIERFRAPKPPPLLFPASMIRTSIAQAAGFDGELRRSQDSDMLIRALLGRRYLLTSAPLYAYRRAAMTVDKTLEGYRYRVRAHAKHLRRHPLHVGRTVSATIGKGLAYRLALAVGLEDRLLERRYLAPTDAIARDFARARDRVLDAHDALWPR